MSVMVSFCAVLFPTRCLGWVDITNVLISQLNNSKVGRKTRDKASELILSFPFMSDIQIVF